MSSAMPTPQPVPGFDPRPLTDPVDKQAAKAYRDELKKQGGSGVNVQFVLIVIAMMFIAVLVFSGLLSFGIEAARPDSPLRQFAFLPALAVVGVGAFLIVRAVRGRNTTTDFRLHNFARANGMAYEPKRIAPNLPGMIFRIGSNRGAFRRVRGTHPRFVEFGNYRYTTGSGKDQTTHRWGYIAIHLDAPLPHIVLDAKGNNSIFGSSLPKSFDRSQRLSLEGDFDKHFTLYCPSGYERDALYLFTPDIMTRFMDNAAQLDIEIVDDWLFLYAKRDFVTTDPRTWGWLFSVVSAVIDKIVRWERWRDERLAAEVAAAGQTAGAATPLQPLGHAVPTDGGALPFHHDEAGSPPPVARGQKGVAQGGQRLNTGRNWVGIGVVIAMFAVFFLIDQFG